jgi:hypothetical protein
MLLTNLEQASRNFRQLPKKSPSVRFSEHAAFVTNSKQVRRAALGMIPPREGLKLNKNF